MLIIACRISCEYDVWYVEIIATEFHSLQPPVVAESWSRLINSTALSNLMLKYLEMNYVDKHWFYICWRVEIYFKNGQKTLIKIVKINMCRFCFSKGIWQISTSYVSIPLGGSFIVQCSCYLPSKPSWTRQTEYFLNVYKYNIQCWTSRQR